MTHLGLKLRLAQIQNPCSLHIILPPEKGVTTTPPVTTTTVTMPEIWAEERPLALPLEVLENTLEKLLRARAGCGRQATAVLSIEQRPGQAVMRS